MSIGILNILSITADSWAMDAPLSTDLPPPDSTEPAQAVLAEVTCTWAEQADVLKSVLAVIVHAARDMLILEAADQHPALPSVGTAMFVAGANQRVYGRLAEHGRTGRFLVSLGTRPVRRDPRLRVSLTGTLRSASLPEPVHIEIADLTTSGARVRGIALAAGSQVALDFTPPGRDEPVTVRARVTRSQRRCRASLGRSRLSPRRPARRTLSASRGRSAGLFRGAHPVDHRLLLLAQGTATPQLLRQGTQEVALPVAPRLEADQLGRIGLNAPRRFESQRFEILHAAVEGAELRQPVGQLVARDRQRGRAAIPTVTDRRFVRSGRAAGLPRCRGWP